MTDQPTYHYPFPEGIEVNSEPHPKTEAVKFRLECGTPILAAREGTARLFYSTLPNAFLDRTLEQIADKDSANIVVVNHDDHTEELYYNLKRGVEVEPGHVDQGQLLGYSNGDLIFTRLKKKVNGTEYDSTRGVRSIPVAFEKREQVHKLIGAYRAYKKNPQLHGYLRKEMKEFLTFLGFEHVLRSVTGECNIYRREHEDIGELLVKEGSLRRGDAELYYIALPTRKADNLVKAYEHVHSKPQIPDVACVVGAFGVGVILGAGYLAYIMATHIEANPPQDIMRSILLFVGGGSLTYAGAKLATVLTAHSRNSAIRRFEEQAVSGEQALERIIKGPSWKQND